MLPTITLTLIAVTLADADPKALHSPTIAITEPCGTADYLNNIKSVLKSKLSAGQLALKAMRKAAAQLRMAAAASTGSAARKYAILCAALDVYAEQKQITYDSALSAAGEGMAAASALSFSQDIIQDLKETKTTEIPPTATTATWLTSGYKAILPKLEVTAGGGCFAGATRKANAAGESRSIGDELQIKLFHLEAEAPAAANTGSNVFCETASTGTALQTCTAYSNAGNLQYRGGKVLKPKGVTYKRTISTNADYAPVQNTPSNMSPPTKRVKELLAQIKKAESEVENLDISFSTENTHFLTKTATLTEIATAIFVPDSKPVEESKHTQTLQPIITANYGSSEKELKNKIWDQVELISVKGAALGATESEPVKNVGELAKLEQAVGFYIAEAAATATPKKLNGTSCKTAEQYKADASDKTEDKKDGDNKTTAAECATTEAEKCDKEKCTWDNCN
ncbi:uncharacterized protein TEOVI_000764200 [Trypanosoma equiperdum]|uniref:Trypanosome variant surface glycoprotein A-type N-terminal domain-containing protein n=1 Tax=Trypanosoma equiperdum TaxID=5694 RepID=A0A1G4I2J4_TRYEQ|nr:hypothetical protein, conserved [Trypanosoma equiperdum]